MTPPVKPQPLDFNDLITEPGGPEPSGGPPVRAGAGVAGSSSGRQGVGGGGPAALDFSDLVKEQAEAAPETHGLLPYPSFLDPLNLPVISADEAKRRQLSYIKAGAEGLFVDLPKMIGQFVSAPFSPPTIEELRNPMTQALMRSGGRGGMPMSEEQIQAEQHAAIIRRATGEEPDLGTLLQYSIPIYGQGKFGADVVEAYHQAKTPEERIRVVTSTAGMLLLGKMAEMKGSRATVENIIGVDPAKVMEQVDAPLTEPAARAEAFKDWKEAAPLQVNDEPPAPPPTVDLRTGVKFSSGGDDYGITITRDPKVPGYGLVRIFKYGKTEPIARDVAVPFSLSGEEPAKFQSHAPDVASALKFASEKFDVDIPQEALDRALGGAQSDQLRGLSDKELAQQPLGETPALEESAAAREYQPRVERRVAQHPVDIERRRGITNSPNLNAEVADVVDKAEALMKAGGNPIPATKILEAQRSGAEPIGDIDANFKDFQAFQQNVQDFPENWTQLPDVKDLQERFPREFKAATQFNDPVRGMQEFASLMSDRLESREVSAAEAESIGGRMEQYLAARMRNELQTSFDAQMREWARSKGIKTGFSNLWQEFADRMGDILRRKYFSIEDWERFEHAKAMDAEPSLDEIASGKGLDVTLTPSGDHVVTDMDTGEPIARVKNNRELRLVTDKVGDAKGVSLDGGGRTNNPPPSAVGKDAMPPSYKGPDRPDDELMEPYKSPENFMQKLHNWERLILSRFFTTRHGTFAAWDDQFKTSFLSDVFGPTQEAKRIASNNVISKVNELAQNLKPLVEDLSPEERKTIFRAMETMTPGEIIEQGFSRRMTPEEINSATLLASQDINLQKVFDFRRMRDVLMQGFKGKQLIEKMDKLNQEFQLDEPHQTAVRLFDYAVTKSRNEFDLGAIVRLADAIMSDSPSRSEFMSQNNFTPQMYQAVEYLDKYFNDLGPEFGVQMRQMIRGYMPHYRVFDGGMGHSKGYLFQKGLEQTPEGKFISTMARTGELDVFEQDPLVAAVRYARAGYMARDFYPALNRARQAAATELSKLPPEQQRYAKQYIDSYFTDIQGRPDAAVSFVQNVTDKTFESLGMDPGISVRRNLIDTISSLVYSSQVGLRPSIMLRHFNQMLALGFIPFGGERVADALRYIADPNLVENIRNARAKGILAQLGPSWLEAPGERGVAQKLLGGLSGWAQRTAEWGMTANGLKGVYELTQYIWYNEARARAVQALNEFYHGKISREAAYEDLNVNWYDSGFIKQFDDIVRQIPQKPELIDRAAHILGMETGRDIAFQYGNANHAPFLSTNAGRLIGIFGVWSSFMMDYTGRVVSRGTGAEIAQRIGRMAALNSAIYAGSKAFGLNMRGWYFMPSLAYLNLTNTGGYPFVHPSNYIPFSGVAKDVNDAFNDPNNQDAFHFFMRLAGIRPSAERGLLW